MEKLESVIKALKFIDHNFQEDLSYITIAEKYNISPYYFHRIFTKIVGKTITDFIRERRLQEAGRYLYNTDHSITEICFNCGFSSHQSFSRIFKNYFGVSPREYRKMLYIPSSQSIEDIIANFRNKTLGGINMEPRIMDQGKLIIAGVSGDGRKTNELWEEFMNLADGVKGRVSDHYYEVRLSGAGINECYIGFNVRQKDSFVGHKRIELPASKYACFDIFVAKGFESSNQAIEQWLERHKDRYAERLFENGAHYAVEYYDERFKGNSEESIVEIWIPVLKL